MWVAVFNNLPELALGLCWTWMVFGLGRRFERRRLEREERQD